jgi:Concanavalin A-like lectin/glucanases superfamily
MIHGPQPIVTNGLVLALDAANQKSYTSGSTIWNDLSGNVNNGTLTNGTTFNSDNGGSIVFDGADDYVSISQNINPSNITLEFFYKTSVSSPYEYLISNSRDCCGTYNGYELQIFNGVPRFSIWNSTQANVNGILTLTNQIYHITATYDGTQLKIYQNSLLTVTANSALGIGSPASFNLAVGGMGFVPSIYNLTGNIYVGRVYNRALSASEIQQNYNSQKSRFNLI